MPFVPIFLFVFSTMLLTGCANDPGGFTSEADADAKVATPFAQGAIELEISTDPDLNSTHGIANSCMLLVIQAQKENTLNKLLSNSASLKNLFSAAGAQDDILKVDRYPAMPGQSTTLHIDRSENSRFIAIVAGYYPFPQEQHMVLVAIPIINESSGLWSQTWRAHLAPLSLKLRLGSNSISEFEGASPESLALTNANDTPTVIEKGD